MSVFSERRVTLMNAHKLTQKELAQKIGVTESAMSYYVKGDRMPRIDVLTRMAQALHTTTDYLLGTVEDCGTAGQEKLQYIQRNLQKLDATQLKKAETILKTVFDDIFDDDDEE